MDELFKTILFLSFLGFIFTSILLILKPVTSKKFPAKWQYYVWVAVLISMIVPVYKLIPEKQVEKITVITTPVTDEQVTQNTFEPQFEMPDLENTNILLTPNKSINVFNLLSIIWVTGFVIFLLITMISYIRYIVVKKKNSIVIINNNVFNIAKEQLKIKRNITLRISENNESPMLLGVLFPAIYLPSKDIQNEKLYLVFVHELTHYKRKDLIIKWFALFVNAVHWFNPLSYLVSANLSEACEVSCDMEVTKNMNEEEQKLYMKTILELVE